MSFPTAGEGMYSTFPTDPKVPRDVLGTIRDCVAVIKELTSLDHRPTD